MRVPPPAPISNLKEATMAETDVKGLLERASIKAGMLRMGEPVAFGSDAAMIEELAEALVDLSNDNDRFIEGQVLMQKEIKDLRAALSGTREAGEPVAEITQECRYCANTGWFYGEPDLRMMCGCAFGKLREEITATPPAEVERGAVTANWREIDLTKAERHEHPDIIANEKQYLVKIYGGWHFGRFSRQWYGLSFNNWGNAGCQFDAPGWNSSGWERVIEIDPEALASPTPAPQPAVEAQGVERYNLVQVENTVGDLVRRLEPAGGGSWVRFTDHQRALASEKARADRLATALRDARDEVKNWGQYASDYFQEKHGLDQALATIDAALRPTTSGKGKAG